MKKLVLGILCSGMLISCIPSKQAYDFGSEWIDLTHPFDSTTLYWPNNKTNFVHTTDYKGFVRPMGYFYSSYSISAPEHGGTHLDAPIHFAENKQTADKIPLERLAGKGIIIDVSQKSLKNRDYQISTEDLIHWEKENGRIEDGDIVLFRTGYAQFYPNREKYFGTGRIGQEAIPELHFPGLGPDAAQWLIENRKIGSFGLDTPSMDYGQSTDFKTHQIMLGHNIPGFENVNIPMTLPSTGIYIVALPMKIGNGSGAPLRIIANVLQH